MPWPGQVKKRILDSRGNLIETGLANILGVDSGEPLQES
ncbi:uncharacterized protein METZ01_LOCUS360972 [marine metagenome]|uniref:Uncharacterized protein n=1 Tax=marine metagenome TaxID=408172 RepID=A0A382SG24_9ZZZZ